MVKMIKTLGLIIIYLIVTIRPDDNVTLVAARSFKSTSLTESQFKSITDAAYIDEWQPTQTTSRRSQTKFWFTCDDMAMSISEGRDYWHEDQTCGGKTQNPKNCSNQIQNSEQSDQHQNLSKSAPDCILRSQMSDINGNETQTGTRKSSKQTQQQKSRKPSKSSSVMRDQVSPVTRFIEKHESRVMGQTSQQQAKMLQQQSMTMSQTQNQELQNWCYLNQNSSRSPSPESSTLQSCHPSFTGTSLDRIRRVIEKNGVNDNGKRRQQLQYQQPQPQAQDPSLSVMSRSTETWSSSSRDNIPLGLLSRASSPINRALNNGSDSPISSSSIRDREAAFQRLEGVQIYSNTQQSNTQQSQQSNSLQFNFERDSGPVTGDRGNNNDNFQSQARLRMRRGSLAMPVQITAEQMTNEGQQSKTIINSVSDSTSGNHQYGQQQQNYNTVGPGFENYGQLGQTSSSSSSQIPGIPSSHGLLSRRMIRQKTLQNIKNFDSNLNIQTNSNSMKSMPMQSDSKGSPESPVQVENQDPDDTNEQGSVLHCTSPKMKGRIVNFSPTIGAGYEEGMDIDGDQSLNLSRSLSRSLARHESRESLKNILSSNVVEMCGQNQEINQPQNSDTKDDDMTTCQQDHDIDNLTIDDCSSEISQSLQSSFSNLNISQLDSDPSLSQYQKSRDSFYDQCIGRDRPPRLITNAARQHWKNENNRKAENDAMMSSPTAHLRGLKTLSSLSLNSACKFSGNSLSSGNANSNGSFNLTSEGAAAQQQSGQTGQNRNSNFNRRKELYNKRFQSTNSNSQSTNRNPNVESRSRNNSRNSNRSTISRGPGSINCHSTNKTNDNFFQNFTNTSFLAKNVSSVTSKNPDFWTNSPVHDGRVVVDDQSRQKYCENLCMINRKVLVQDQQQFRPGTSGHSNSSGNVPSYSGIDDHIIKNINLKNFKYQQNQTHNTRVNTEISDVTDLSLDDTTSTIDNLLDHPEFGTIDIDDQDELRKHLSSSTINLANSDTVTDTSGDFLTPLQRRKMALSRDCKYTVINVPDRRISTASNSKINVNVNSNSILNRNLNLNFKSKRRNFNQKNFSSDLDYWPLSFDLNLISEEDLLSDEDHDTEIVPSSLQLRRLVPTKAAAINNSKPINNLNFSRF